MAIQIHLYRNHTLPTSQYDARVTCINPLDVPIYFVQYSSYLYNGPYFQISVVASRFMKCKLSQIISYRKTKVEITFIPKIIHLFRNLKRISKAITRKIV